MPDNFFEEPPINPQEDTQPTQTMPQVSINDEQPATESSWRRLIGLMSLFGALGLTLATIFLVLNPPETPDSPPPDTSVIESVTDVPATDVPQETAPPSISTTGELVEQLPTLDPDLAQVVLASALSDNRIGAAASIDRNLLDPFTIIPDRPRSEVIRYEVVQGDTIEAIAQRFGLQSETIAWSNPRRIVQVLRPGDELYIPPVDGVLATAIGSTRTIADYTSEYKLDDPYDVLDSPYNRHLVGFTPDTVPPSGTQIFFPGGEAETIIWVAEIEVTEGGTSGGSSGQANVATVVFQNGQPGSCAPQPITGGTFWTSPVPSGYTITRGYSGYHPGIDLANSEGTPIVAANGGRVIFSGWNSFGYGYMVALIHGPTMTVYGHMSGQPWVSCGQDVAAGQQIGLMGSTGNSSGPHLHFEIRSRQGNTYVPHNPAATIGF